MSLQPQKSETIPQDIEMVCGRLDWKYLLGLELSVVKVTDK
ncbi:hypothetical protein [Candidatus Chlorohelix allophototropha]